MLGIYSSHDNATVLHVTYPQIAIVIEAISLFGLIVTI